MAYGHFLHHHHHSPPPRNAIPSCATTTMSFLLERQANLLCYLLYLPLLPLSASDLEAETVRMQILGSNNTTNNSKHSQPAPRITRRPPTNKPALSVKDERVVTVWAPHTEEKEKTMTLKKWFQITLPDGVDGNRSTLTSYGDHLVARLAFSSFAQQRDSRLEREAAIPAMKELDVNTYMNGLHCKQCSNMLVKPMKLIGTIHRAPKLPWSEIVECLTCVKPEDYKASPLVDRAFLGERVTPAPSCVLVGESWIAINGEDVMPDAIMLTDDGHPPLSCGEHEAYEGNSSEHHHHHHHHPHWRHITCHSCHTWMGDALVLENGAIELRIFKFALGGSSFHYRLESVVVGILCEAARTRECYRFVLACGSLHSNIMFARMTMLNETFVRTQANENLQPAVKVLFWVHDPAIKSEAAHAWAQEHGAEWILLPNAEACMQVVTSLEQSNLTFPHSARIVADAKVGYLTWMEV